MDSNLYKEIGGETDPPPDWFCQIFRDGTEHKFNDKMNDEWVKQTRPMLPELTNCGSAETGDYTFMPHQEDEYALWRCEQAYHHFTAMRELNFDPLQAGSEMER